MIKNYVCFRDYETGAKNPNRCQAVQLAAVIIDMQRLSIVENSTFESMIGAEIDDEAAIAQNVDPLEDQALQINGKTREQIAEAPPPNIVWGQYQKYLKKYNLKGESGGKWDAPIVAGFNNTNFDDIIDKRFCVQYGPELDDFGGFQCYHPTTNYDLKILVQTFFHRENLTPGGRSYSMDACRDYFGYSKDMAHDALCDVVQGADLLIRFLRFTKRLIDGSLSINKGKRVKFKGCVTDKDNEFLDGLMKR